MRNAFIYIPFSVIALAVDLRVILMLPAIIGNSFFFRLVTPSKFAPNLHF